jgi:hypothetical protein
MFAAPPGTGESSKMLTWVASREHSQHPLPPDPARAGGTMLTLPTLIIHIQPRLSISMDWTYCNALGLPSWRKGGQQAF